MNEEANVIIILIAITICMFTFSRYYNGNSNKRESIDKNLDNGIITLIVGILLIYLFTIISAYYSLISNNEIKIMLVCTFLIVCFFTAFGWIFKKEKLKNILNNEKD